MKGGPITESKLKQLNLTRSQMNPRDTGIGKEGRKGQPKYILNMVLDSILSWQGDIHE